MELLSRRVLLGSGCVGLILALVGGCRAGTPSAPSKLIDGSPARPPPVLLEGVEGPSVATVVRVTPAGAVAPTSYAGSCIAAVGEAAGAVVERVGVSGRSVTFLGPGRRTAHACDASTVGAEEDTWCGHAFAQVDSGRRRDPRLSLTCRSGTGDPVGFAWIEPGVGTTYVVVQGSGYAEAYVAAADAPVRVTTDEVGFGSSRAAFSVSEHAKSGRRLRSYELEARVAG
jgi:hypothetical protein